VGDLLRKSPTGPWDDGFGDALGELRGTFGIHVARLAAQYGLDIEDELASILPAQMRTRVAQGLDAP